MDIREKRTFSATMLNYILTNFGKSAEFEEEPMQEDSGSVFVEKEKTA